jgi:hypothetical protein
VANYRLYRLDGAGKITSAEWIEADGDDGAADHARTLGLDCTCEVWDRQRMVARIPRKT